MLGLDIGTEFGHGVEERLEDRSFCCNTLGSMLSELSIRNADGWKPVWGWKYPDAANYLHQLLPHLVNPRFIVVWRDPFTSAMRKMTSVQMERDACLLEIESNAIRHVNNVSFIRSTDAPCLLVSYEKAILRPEKFITQIASFIGMPEPASTDEMISFMAPGRYK
jgi:hypothetical protein